MERKELVAYAAGLIDGEGCLSIRRNLNGKSKYFSFTIIVCMKEREPLERLQTLWGGSIGKIFRKPIHGGETRVFHRWVIATKSAHIALQEMYPYLIGKRQEADVAIAFAEDIIKHNGFRYQKSKAGVQKLPESVIKHREELFHQLSELKRIKYQRIAPATTESRNLVYDEDATV